MLSVTNPYKWACWGTLLCSPVLAQSTHPVITSISVCSSGGGGGTGSCPGGTFDTHKIVLAPDGRGNAFNNYEASGTSDEHSSVFSPGTLGSNNDYLFFVASGTNASSGIGTVVLSGGAGPDKNSQWTFDLPRSDGYGSYAAGFGQVFRQPYSEPTCPVVADGNPAHQDPTFDLNYAAPGSVVKDPTSAPGNLIMIYEGTNTCVGNSGGNRAGSNSAYISTAVATSLDYGKTWPTYRATPAFNFVPLPGFSKTQGPSAPSGALGKNVCMGNDCSTTPPAAYGRYPVLTPPTSIATVMAAGQTLQGNIGDSQVAAFLDDVNPSPTPYLYVVHNLAGNSGGTDLAIARAQLNGGTAPLNFTKWSGQSFSTPGIGGAQGQLLPNGAYQSCGGQGQERTGGSVEYVEATQQYLLLFTCRSPSDPAVGPGSGNTGVAWFYSTSTDLSDPTKWTTPQEIAGSWSEIDSSGGCPSYKGWYPTMMSLGSKPGHLSTSGYVFYLWGCETGAGDANAPNRQFSSRAFTITTDVPLQPFVNAGQAMTANGGSGSINVTFPAGYAWTASTTADWITITGLASGVGNGTVSYQIAPNAGGDRTASVTVAGFAYTIEQSAAAISGLVPAGSLGQVASEGGWDFSLIGINLGASAATARFSFADNNGNPLMLPLTFPQLPSAVGPELASTLDRTLNPNAQVVMESTGPDSATALAGSGQLLSTGSVSGFGIFSNPKVHWNAVVPLETRNASKYILAFDNTVPLTTGLAIANLAALQQNIQVIIRDDTGSPIGNPSPISLSALGHDDFMLPDRYPATKLKRGTIEFDTPPGGQISILGLRANGAALTTLPVLANVDTSGGSITHVAFNGGWTSVFYIGNTGTASAQFTLSFVDENGVALPVPLLLPQSGATPSTSPLTKTLAAGAMLVVETQAQDAPATLVVGSAQLTTTGNISGFEIFRWTTFNQEASVPLETRTPNSFVLVFDDTGGLTTGVALASNSALLISVTATFRDDTGAQIGVPQSITLAAHGHKQFLLPELLPAVTSRRGMVEFAAPPGQTFSVIGLRARSSDGTLTTIPVLTK